MVDLGFLFGGEELGAGGKALGESDLGGHVGV